MTDAADTADLAPPRDPAAYGRRRGFGAAAWLILLLCVVCLIAGGVGAIYVQKFLLQRAPGLIGAAPLVAPTPAPASPLPAATPAPAAAPAPVIPPPDVSGLETRLTALERAQGGSTRAAASALAAASLSDAAQSSRPFGAELTVLEQLLPQSPSVRALRPMAESGAPSRAALAADFDAAAAEAANAARAPADGANILDQVLHALTRVFTLRRVASTNGNAPDAVLARAQRQVNEGDIDAALKTLILLPPKAADAMSGWRARAQQRVSLDRHVAAIRAEALEGLTQAAPPAPAPSPAPAVASQQPAQAQP